MKKILPIIKPPGTMFEQIVAFIREEFATDKFIPLHEPRFLGKEKEYVLDAIDSTFVSSVGAYVGRFESMLADITGASYAVATVNGTSALHVALLMAGVKPGDLVITQPLTFVATANAITYTGARPVFVDVEKDTMGLSAEKIDHFLKTETVIENDACVHKKTGKRVSACVPMHTFGFPLRVDEIIEICTGYNIPVVEDAAESLGSLYRGKHTGTMGELGILSFNGNKTLTCGGGGAIVTNDESLAKKAKHITTTAKKNHQWAYEHDMTAFNYRLPNLNAALACAQLEQLDKFIIQKRKLAGRYKTFFDDYEACFIDEIADAKANFWLNTILLNDREERDEFLEYSNAGGLMTRPAWKLMTDLPMYAHDVHGDISNARWLQDRIVNLPSSVPLHEKR